MSTMMIRGSGRVWPAPRTRKRVSSLPIFSITPPYSNSDIGSIAGPTAAQNVGKSGSRDNNYRFNQCAIGSLTCIVLPEIVPVKPRPVEHVTVLSQQQFNDPTINLLNVGDEDLVLTSEATPDSDTRQ